MSEYSLPGRRPKPASSRRPSSVLRSLDIDDTELSMRREAEEKLRMQCAQMLDWIRDEGNRNDPRFMERLEKYDLRRQELADSIEESARLCKRLWAFIDVVDDPVLREKAVARILEFEEAPF